MKIILLTHAREISKKSNTGQLVQQLVPNAQTIIWQRTQPDFSLLKLIQSKKTALLYPIEKIGDDANVNDFENFIVIDSTWQESRKIVNRSPYLQQLPRVQVSTKKHSQYHLRRNQIEGGLCTAECVIELLREKNNVEMADQLDILFARFLIN